MNGTEIPASENQKGGGGGGPDEKKDRGGWLDAGLRNIIHIKKSHQKGEEARN